MAVPLQSAARAPLRPRCHRIAVTMPLQSARAPPRPRCHCLAHRRAARRRADCHCSQHDHFRSLWLRGSTHNAVSSWPMAATECRALLHCIEVHAMRLWPVLERGWLRALSMSPLQRPTREAQARFDCDAVAGTGVRVQQSDAMPWPLLWMQVVCTLTAGTEGRTLGRCRGRAAIALPLQSARCLAVSSSTTEAALPSHCRLSDCASHCRHGQCSRLSRPPTSLLSRPPTGTIVSPADSIGA